MKNKGLWKKIKEKTQEDVESLVNLLGHRFNHIIVSLFYGIDEGLNLICNFYYVVL